MFKVFFFLSHSIWNVKRHLDIFDHKSVKVVSWRIIFMNPSYQWSVFIWDYNIELCDENLMTQLWSDINLTYENMIENHFCCFDFMERICSGFFFVFDGIVSFVVSFFWMSRDSYKHSFCQRNTFMLAF